MRDPRAVVSRLVLAAALAVILVEPAWAGTRRILVLHSFGRDVEPHAAFGRAFRTELAGASTEPVEFYELSLATAMLDDGAAEPAFLQYLSVLENERRFELVVAIGGPAARFVQRHRDVLFAATPMLIASTDVRHLQDGRYSPLDAAVPSSIPLGAAIDNVLRLLPETEEILVVLGHSPFETFWAGEFRKSAAPFTDRVRFTYTNDLPFRRILGRAAGAPPRTAIIYALFLEDADGVPYGEDTALSALHASAHAPVFGLWEYQLGNGIVGGPLIDLAALAKRSAEVAARILSGEPPSRFREVVPTEVRAYDAAELSRWKIDRDRLPAGSEIRFEKPTFWSAYRGRILVAAAVAIGQGILIAWLLSSRRRRRRAEAEFRDVSRRLVAAQEDERARLARELHDDISQRLARAVIDAGRIEAGAPGAASIGEVRRGLVRLSEDVHVLAYSLHPSLLEDLGLEEAIRAECDRLSADAGIPVSLVVEGLVRDVSRPAARCVYRVVQETLRNVARHAAAANVDVRLRGASGGIELTVRDDGVGFNPSAAKERRTLGLVSMRERVRMAGGRFAIHTAPGDGTKVSAWIPAAEPGA